MWPDRMTRYVVDVDVETYRWVETKYQSLKLSEQLIGRSMPSLQFSHD